MEKPVNAVTLTGCIAAMPMFSHDSFGESFYQFTLSVSRLSGVCDMLPITASEHLLDLVSPEKNLPVRLEGQIRSYNKGIDGHGKLLITVFARRLSPPGTDDGTNAVTLAGTLCKPPSFRTTPFGREIADIMLAINRSFGKSDYIPCITWGQNARYAARLSVGDTIAIEGRLQSRPYQKQLPNGTMQDKVAYEVSVRRLGSVSSRLAPNTEDHNANGGEGEMS